jgi:DNA polymerase I-like protein with 3'-5' exonuclease and polymerase domains
MVGLAVGTDDGYRRYFPFAHDMGNNLPREAVLQWAKDNLTKAGQPKVGANLLYDLDYLYHAGVPVAGPFYDVQVAEPLIDELSRDYSLGALMEKYTGEGKPEDEMYEWLSAAFGGPATRRAQAGNIWRAPAEVVGPYAEGDVDGPFRVLEAQQRVLKEQELETVFEVETRLIPLLLAMRQRGVRVAVDQAEMLDATLASKAEQLRGELAAAGVDPNKHLTLAKYCDGKGIRYLKTPKGNPSFPGQWLLNHNDPLLRKVADVRRLEKHAGTFLQGYILKHAINGRIHCQFHQLRGDEYGAVSGRFSSSDPNLQNIPARDEELGPLVRGMFLPDEGELWGSDDWSQIEYRLLVHYAMGIGAREAREQYRRDPKVDFHQYVADLSGIDRRPAKGINFGLVYGMGEPAMASNLGRPLHEVKPLFQQYHDRFPFVRNTYNRVSKRAEERGYIKTLLGRRRRFPYFEAANWDEARAYRESGGAPMLEVEARAKWSNVRRGYCHKALNGLLQGGAADIMKMAMVKIWESGVCDVLGAPLSTVHDELNWSIPQTREGREAHQEAVSIMESCVPLRVPLVCDAGIGANWGEAH